MSVVSENFSEIFSRKSYFSFSIVLFLLLSYIFHIFTNYALIVGNYSSLYLYVQIMSQFVISLLFALFLPITIYKIRKFSAFSVKKQGTSVFATAISLIVGGCPACSITIASYLGLAGFVSFFPYAGLELKLITIPLLGYATYSTLNTLNVCKVKKKK